ncbi:phosphatase PAP2 family protein [Lentisphaerota bacterium ZTH]|nr:phosphatase PAP2 family protein [Lentisphaerota bacterium]WET05624.1 phosphatase PAP2 family protein [Lentisphaerota bacterium ZTH]
MKNKKLLICIALTLLTAILCTVSVLYVDKPLSYAMHEIRIGKYYDILFYMQFIVDIMHKIFPIVLLYLIVKYMIGKFACFDRFLFTATTGCLAANSIRGGLKFVFGRTWTETFKDANPSLIQNGVYRFNFFHGSEIAFQSFPSGHSIIIFAFATALWLMYPKARGVAAALCAIVVIGLLGCNFHFLGDIIAGAFIGIFTTLMCYNLINVQMDKSQNAKALSKQQ